MNEVIEQFKSVHLQNERTIWIRPPRDAANTKHVTVFLDAELYRDKVDAVSVIDDLEQGMDDSWFVFVSVESFEARWLECPCYPPFAAFIAEELIPWVERRFKMNGIQRRTLVGLSYTGLAAAFIAKKFPGLFHHVISQSGSFWWNNCWLIAQYRSSTPVPTEFYLSVGTREIQENVQHREGVLQVVSQIEGVRRFRDALLSSQHVVKFVEFEGAHDCADWKKTLPDALRWALSCRVAEPTDMGTGAGSGAA